MKKPAVLIMLALFIPALSGCPGKPAMEPAPEFENPVTSVRSDASRPLLAGFARQAITPRSPVFIAGFGPVRLSYGAHDDIQVRTVVLKQGEMKLAMVAVDVIGIHRTDALQIKNGVKNFSPSQIIIASTHTHAGPDTLGLWGLPPVISGRSDRYMRRIGRAVAETIEEAEARAVEVTPYAAVFQLDPGIMVNFNEGEPEDENAGIMVFKDREGKVVGTLLNVNGHPEAMWSDNHYLSADYPGRLCQLVEGEYGGGAVFFSAALGAMMSPARPGPGEKHDFERLERISQSIFAEVKRGMGMLDPVKPRLSHKSSLILFPARNDRFKLLLRTGILDRELYTGEKILTSVHLVEIGDAQFVTFPGEAYPKLGLKVRESQKPLSFQIGLADDELGYIIYPEDYGTELYEYESSMCAGPELSVMIERELIRLLSE